MRNDGGFQKTLRLQKSVVCERRGDQNMYKMLHCL